MSTLSYGATVQSAAHSLTSCTDPGFGGKSWTGQGKKISLLLRKTEAVVVSPVKALQTDSQHAATGSLLWLVMEA